MKNQEALKQDLREMSMRDLMRTLNFYEQMINEGDDMEENFNLVDQEISRRLIVNHFNRMLVETL